MINRRETRCMVLSCKFNHGENGTVCDYALYGSECQFTPKVQEWLERGGLACFTHLDQDDGDGRDPGLVEVVEIVQPSGPRSLTWRADKAHRAADPLTPERARQRALALEVELSEVER